MTRAEYNLRFNAGHKNQTYEIPEHGAYLWSWFSEVMRGHQSVIDGVPLRLTWDRLYAWASLMRRIVLPSEYAILLAMSDAWCSAMGDELADQRARDKAAEPSPPSKPVRTRRPRR